MDLSSKTLTSNNPYLTGQLLIAMPNMGDQRFERTVIYMCAHSEEGAMGLVVNKLLSGLSFSELLKQFEIENPPGAGRTKIHFGGPVEPGRGFVLHSGDYRREGTMLIDDEFGLTATIEVLRDIAAGQGPRSRLVALGYAGWAPGQLDAEIQANAWLNVPADEDLLFSTNQTDKWPKAVRKLGIDLSLLSTDAGHA